MSEVPAFVNLRELEELARARVPKPAFDYIAGGAGDELTLAENHRAFGQWRLRPRVLRDVSKRDTATTVLGDSVSLPVLVAPTAFHKLVHPDGEAATARGAARGGSLMISSTLATVPLEEVARAAAGPKWFQLYIYKDRQLTEDLVQRAKAAGYKALVVTVDAAAIGKRERDVRNGFTLPPGLGLANFAGMRGNLPALGSGASGLAAYVSQQLDPALSWEDVAWLRRVSGLPVIVKGILTAEDARLAIDHRCDGIVVSNHGGRQLDACVASLDALPEVVEAVGDAAEVYVDGGIRRGTDVLVALALGARAVLVGRPILYGLALGGPEGVAKVLALLREELDLALALCGLRSPHEATADLLLRRP